MKKTTKILRLEYGLCVALLLSGMLLAQSARRPRQAPQPQSDFSTPDLEAQPNTAQYPGRQPPLPNPGPPTTDGTQPSPTPVPAYSYPPQPPVPLNPATARPAIVNPGTPAAPVTAVPQASTNRPQASAPPRQVLIGPPAPVPPTPEQMAPTPPKITYQNGLLSIESTNSRLGDILNGVHNKTGIQVEGAQAAPERVAGKFGPAPVDEVLINLLRGSRFDYVILGLPDNPTLVQRVILTPNSAAATVAAPPGSQPPPVIASEEEDSEESQGEPQEQVHNPQQTPNQPRSPVNAGPRTQEQLLEELKLMQQQNQQQNPNQQNAPIKPRARRPSNPQ